MFLIEITTLFAGSTQLYEWLDAARSKVTLATVGNRAKELFRGGWKLAEYVLLQKNA